MMQKKGFTLLEVLIVVIIIGVLAAIALPQYTNTIEKARAAEATANIGALRSAMDRYWYEQTALQTTYTAATLTTLDVDNPNDVTNRFYDYTLTDNSNLTTRTYTITANRNKAGSTLYVEWQQTDNNTGALYKSSELGGPPRP